MNQHKPQQQNKITSDLAQLVPGMSFSTSGQNSSATNYNHFDTRGVVAKPWTPCLLKWQNTWILNGVKCKSETRKNEQALKNDIFHI